MSTVGGRGWVVGVALTTVVGAALRAAVFARSLPVLDRLFVPDDTYYTLTIARSLAHGDGPTTDGHTLTSGFQPLIAFLMVPVYWATDSADAALRADIALLLALDVAVVVLLALLGRRLAGPLAGLVAGGIWAVSPAAVRVAAGGLETTLAVACELGFVLVWLCARDRPSTLRWTIVGVVAALAVLARIDALALVALVALVQVWKGPRRRLVPAVVAMAVTLAPWWGYCLARFGTPVPTSGSAAHDLQGGTAFNHTVTAAASGSVLSGPVAVFSDVHRWATAQASAWPYWAAVAVACALGIGLVAVAARRRSDHVEAAVLGALALFATALILFYGWLKISYYMYRYLSPVAAVQALLLGALAGWAVTAARRRGSKPTVVTVGATAVVCATLAWSAGTGFAKLLRWDDRTPASSYSLEAATGYRQQARWLNTVVPDGATVGANQSGALGYFVEGRRTVVNLDGVVNPDAARALRQDRIVSYVRARRIGWIADWALTVIAYDVRMKAARPPGSVEVVARLTPPGNALFLVGRVEPAPGAGG